MSYNFQTYIDPTQSSYNNMIQSGSAYDSYVNSLSGMYDPSISMDFAKQSLEPQADANLGRGLAGIGANSVGWGLRRLPTQGLIQNTAGGLAQGIGQAGLDTQAAQQNAYTQAANQQYSAVQQGATGAYSPTTFGSYGDYRPTSYAELMGIDTAPNSADRNLRSGEDAQKVDSGKDSYTFYEAAPPRDYHKEQVDAQKQKEEDMRKLIDKINNPTPTPTKDGGIIIPGDITPDAPAPEVTAPKPTEATVIAEDKDVGNYYFIRYIYLKTRQPIPGDEGRWHSFDSKGKMIFE